VTSGLLTLIHNDNTFTPKNFLETFTSTYARPVAHTGLPYYCAAQLTLYGRLRFLALPQRAALPLSCP